MTNRGKKVDATCVVCGKPFLALVQSVKKGAGCYCSRLCFSESLKKRIEVACPTCGTVFETIPSRIEEGRGKYCSTVCMPRDHTTTHGMSYTRLYKAWDAIIQRCENENDERYPEYGGRGISMCTEWRLSFESFRDWAMANGYADNLSIDRIRNNGNYEPGNCRWTNQSVQGLNKRKPRGNSSSKYKGVHWCKFTGRWRCMIRFMGKTYRPPRFDSEFDAAMEYDRLMLSLLPDTMELNFPRSETVWTGAEC